MPTFNIPPQFNLVEGSPGDDAQDASFNVYLVADGYQSVVDFELDCRILFDDEHLGRYTPFEKIGQTGIPLAIWNCYPYITPFTSVAIGSGAYDPQTTATTPMGAYYRLGQGGQPGQFQLDYAKVVSVLSSFRLSPGVPLLVSGVQDTTQIQDAEKQLYTNGVIIILSPAQAATAALTPQDILNFEYEHLATETENLYFAATSCNAGAERVLARIIGARLGLGDESETVVGQPDYPNGLRLSQYPNLLYANISTPEVVNLAKGKWGPLATTPITVTFKADAQHAPLDTRPGPLTRPSAPVVVYEGGGGYSNGIYRSAHDCLMRQPIGAGGALKQGQHDFCPVCRQHLLKALEGNYSVKQVADFPTLTTQRSEYNKVTWAHVDTYDKRHPAQASYIIDEKHDAFKEARFITRTDDIIPDAFWTYTCQVTGGFQLKDMVVRQSQYYDANFKPAASLNTDKRDVFSSISFEGLVATFSDGSTHTFDVARLLSAGRYELKLARNGRVGLDGLYQTGVKLTLRENTATMPYMEVQLSAVMRGPAADFDPGAVAIALKVYPQVQFCWSPQPGVAKTVVHFDSTVRVEANPKHYHYATETGEDGMGMAGMSSMPDMPGMPMHRNLKASDFGKDESRFYAHDLKTDASSFADSNTSLNYGAPRYYDNLNQNYKPTTRLKREGVETLIDPAAFVRSTLPGILVDVLPDKVQQVVEDAMERHFPRSVHFFDAKAKPTWATVFDYYYPNIVSEDGAKNADFVAVHGPLAGRQSKVRKLYVRHKVEDNPTHPEKEHNEFFITKYARQGAYDNIHINGQMGKHLAFAEQAAIQAKLLDFYKQQPPISANGQQPPPPPPQLYVEAIKDMGVVAAPFCGTDCFHLHWRWSLLSESIAYTPLLNTFYNISPESYRGWSESASHSKLGAPLIPPNQELRIAFEAKTGPSTVRTAAETTPFATQPLPEERKVLKYQARVVAPAPDQNQVTLEQGMGWAMIYSNSKTVDLAELSCLAAPPMPVTAPPLFELLHPFGKARNHFKMFDKVYDFIRFHHTYDLGAGPFANSFTIHPYAQIPVGTDLPTKAWPTDDNMVNTYRGAGRAAYNSGPYTPEQQVVADDTHPELFSGTGALVNIANM